MKFNFCLDNVGTIRILYDSFSKVSSLAVFQYFKRVAISVPFALRSSALPVSQLQLAIVIE